MQLKAYLDENEMSPADFAAGVGSSVHAVYKWIRGERMPRPNQMKRISEFTEGQVAANDFYTEAA